MHRIGGGLFRLDGGGLVTAAGARHPGKLQGQTKLLGNQKIAIMEHVGEGGDRRVVRYNAVIGYNDVIFIYSYTYIFKRHELKIIHNDSLKNMLPKMGSITSVHI